MKKVIKLFLLIIVIIFTIGITTSNAYKVEDTTSVNDMLYELNKPGGTILITNAVRKNNPNIFCRRHDQILPDSGANYFLEYYVEYPAPNGADIQYYSGETNPTNSYSNQYAIAYILAAPRNIYEKEDIQQAYWMVLGFTVDEPTSKANTLLSIARAYQNYINQDTQQRVTVQNNNAKIEIIDGNVAIYGPINIEYKYGSIQTEKFGGFNYAFFDTDGNNVNSNVQLCTLSNNTYNQISATTNTNNYKEVRTANYNRTNLYIKINLNQLSNVNKINMRIQDNKLNVSATVYQINGNYITTSTTHEICFSCLYKIRHSYDEVDKLGIGSIVKYGKRYYTYVGKSTNTSSWTYDRECYNKYSFDGTVSDSEKSAEILAGRTVDEYGNVITNVNYWLEQFADSKYTRQGGMSGYISYSCDLCGASITDYGDSKTNRKNHAGNHTKSQYQYKVTTYMYTTYRGCGNDNCGQIISAGVTNQAQKLTIVDSHSYNESNTLVMDIEIPLTTSIEVTKVWSDYSNKYGLRPDTVRFNVYRSTNQNATTWEKLTENTDYKVEWESTTGDTWKAMISGLLRMDSNGNKYYFKVEEQPLDYYDVTRATYSSGSFTDGRVADTEGQKSITIDNPLKYVKIGGYVWLDGQTGIKPAVPYNGNMDTSEEKLKDIVVYLYYKDPTTDVISRIAQTKTNSNGHYQFETKTRRR